MKRSEILQLIENLYLLEIRSYPKENPPKMFAQNLLGHLEEKGMLPPAHPIGAVDGPEWVTNTWEPET